MAFVRAASRTASVVGRRVAAPTPVRTTTRRMMSHDGTPEELAQTADTWFKISMIGCAAAVIPYSAYMVYVESNHEHHAKSNYDHMQIRKKPLPWGKCDLLDKHCREALEGGH